MSDETPKGMGRPTDYTPEKADAIIARLEEGETLSSVCRDDSMPYRSVVKRWRENFPDFQARYALAREAGLEVLADDILDVSDDGRRDYVETDKGPVVDHDHIARSRLRVDSRKWLLSKLLPKTYGDKLGIGNPDGSPFKEPIFNMMGFDNGGPGQDPSSA